MSAPNLMVWLPWSLVQLLTNWNCRSFWRSGQLQRANRERVAEVELVAGVAARTVAVEEERRHPAAEIVDVQAGNARLGGRVRAAAARIDVDVVAEPAEPEIGQEGRAERVIEPGREALVASPGNARERRRLVEAAPARQLAEDARRVQPVVGQAVAAEHVRRSAEEIVPPGVGEVLVELDGAGPGVVGLIAHRAFDVRQRNELEQILRLRRQARGRNPVAGELLALGQRRAAGRIEDVDPQAAEIALPFGRRRHAQQRRTAGVAPRPLVVAEEEHLVHRHRTAQRAAELVPLRDRNVAIGAGNLLKLRERVARVEDVVAQEVRHRAADRLFVPDFVCALMTPAVAPNSAS